MTDELKIGPGHVCPHGVRWPYPCDPCDAAAWRNRLSKQIDPQFIQLEADMLASQARQIEALRGLVEQAYREGHMDGEASDFVRRNPKGDWLKSTARATLEETSRG